LLESHDLKPWREKNVVRGEVGPGVHRSHGGRAQDVRKAPIEKRTGGVPRRKAGGSA
jgi:hypothetical protein